MPRVSATDGLAGLLDRQLSVASRGQLLNLGLKDNAMQYRIRAGGPWQTLLPGVYLTAAGEHRLRATTTEFWSDGGHGGRGGGMKVTGRSGDKCPSGAEVSNQVYLDGSGVLFFTG